MDTPLSQLGPITQARSHFPAMEDCTYLDLGGRGILSREVRSAIDAHLDDAMYGNVDKDRLFEKTEKARNRFAQLVNAEPDEITYTKNVSSLHRSTGRAATMSLSVRSSNIRTISTCGSTFSAAGSKCAPSTIATVSCPSMK